MSRLRLTIGDVFTVPIDENRTGVGQVVGTYGKDAYYLAIFDVAAPVGAVDVDAALDSRVLFLALSMDAKVAAGHWAVVDNRSVRSDMPLPAYKEMVGGPDHVDVVDHSGQQRRPARGAEAELLPNRKVVAPVRLENALRAKHGLGPWQPAYTDLAPDTTTTTASLFG